MEAKDSGGCLARIMMFLENNFFSLLSNVDGWRRTSLSLMGNYYSWSDVDFSFSQNCHLMVDIHSRSYSFPFAPTLLFLFMLMLTRKLLEGFRNANKEKLVSRISDKIYWIVLGSFERIRRGSDYTQLAITKLHKCWIMIELSLKYQFDASAFAQISNRRSLVMLWLFSDASEKRSFDFFLSNTNFCLFRICLDFQQQTMELWNFFTLRRLKVNIPWERKIREPHEKLEKSWLLLFTICFFLLALSLCEKNSCKGK